MRRSFHAIFEEVEIRMKRLLFLIIIIAAGCCGSYEIQQRRLEDRSFFKPWYRVYRFTNETGEISEITSGKVNCELEDPHISSVEECMKYEDEFCGQAFAYSTEHPGKLDFSLRESYWQTYSFIFNDCYFEVELNNVLDSLIEMEVNGVMYGDVFVNRPVGLKTDPSIQQFYFSVSQGPIRYELRNGEVWNLIP